MVKQATKPVVSKDEEKYRKGLFPEVNLVKNKNILCTSCNQSVKEAMLKGKTIAHPFLDTLLCEKCFDFFGDGDFSVDEDGSDKYCRWCGQGGTLYLCSTCTGGFCKKCIKRNLPRSALKEVENDNWDCYCCNVKPLYELRAHCWAALEFAQTIKPTKADDSSSKKRKHGREKKKLSDDEKEESNPRKRSKIQEESKSNSNEKKQIKVAANKLADFAADCTKLSELIKKKGIEFKGRKSFGKSVSSLEDVDKTKDKIARVLEEVEESAREMRSNLTEYIENWHKVLESEKEGEEEEEDKKSEEEKDMGSVVHSEEEEKKENSDSDEDKQDKSQENGETEDAVKPSNEESGSGDKSEDEKTEEKTENDDDKSLHEDDDEDKA